MSSPRTVRLLSLAHIPPKKRPPCNGHSHGEPGHLADWHIEGTENNWCEHFLAFSEAHGLIRRTTDPAPPADASNPTAAEGS